MVDEVSTEFDPKVDLNPIVNPAINTNIVDVEVKQAEAKKAVDTYLKTDEQISTQEAYNNKGLAEAINPVWNYQPKTVELDQVFKRSPEMAKVITPEADMWDDTVYAWRAFKQGVTDKAKLQAQRGEVAFKIMETRNRGQRADNDDKIKLKNITDKLDSLPDYAEDSPFFGSIGEAVGTYVYNLGDNAPYVGLATAAATFLGGPGAAAEVFTKSSLALTVDDYYRQGAGDFYISRKLDPKNQMSENELYYWSQGIGGLEGVVGALTGRYGARVVSNAIAKNPAMKPFIQKLGNLVVDSGMDALSGVASSLSQIIGEKVSRREDVNIQSVIVDNQDRILQEIALETLVPRVIEAGSAGVKGGLSKAANSPFVSNQRGSVENPFSKGLPKGQGQGTEPVKPDVNFVLPKTNEQIKKSFKLLETEKVVSNIENKLKSSKLSPDVFNETLNLVHEDDTPFHLDMDKVDKLIGSSKVASDAFEKYIGKRENIKSDTYTIGYKDLIKLRLANPEFNETWSTEPKGPPVSLAKSYLNTLLENVDAAEEIAESTTGMTMSEREGLAKGLEKPNIEETKINVTQPEQMINRPIWTTADTKLIFPEKFTAKFEQAVQAVRVSAANQTIATKVENIGKMVNLDATVKRRLGIEAVTGNDQSLKYNVTLNKFKNPPEQSNPKSANYDPTLAESVFAINPDTVPSELAEYKNSGALIRNKVFKTKTEIETVVKNKAKGTSKVTEKVQKGADATEVAAKLGYQSVQELFDAIIIADGEQDLVNDFLKEYDQTGELYKSVEEIGITEDDILDALNEDVKIRQREVRTYFDQRIKEIELVETENPVRPFKAEKTDKTIKGVRSLTKEAIKKTARGFRSQVSLSLEAIKTARTLNLRNSNPDTYRTNATRQHKDAVAAALKGEFEKAVRLSNSSSLNLMIEKELRKLNSKLDRNLNRVAKLTTKENMNTIARAPKPVIDVIGKLMSVIEYNREYDVPAKETVDLFMNTTNPDAYYDLLVDPDTPKATVRDLPVGTVLGLTEVLLDAFKQASDFDSMTVENDLGASVVKTEQVVADAVSSLKQMPTYKEGKTIDPDPNFIQSFAQSVSDFTATLLRAQTVIDLIDKGTKSGRKFRDLMWQPINDAYTRSIKMEASLKQYLNEKVGNYGSKDFVRMRKKLINDPKFTNSVYAKKGKFTKLQLFLVALNTGNPSSLKEMARSMKLDEQVLLDTVDKYMEKRDWDAVHAIWKTFDVLWDENVKTLRENGEDVPEKVSNLARKTKDGINIEGGYYPLAYAVNGLTFDIKKLGKSNESKMFTAGMMTFNGHNIERQGSSHPVALNPFLWEIAISDIAYDASMRTPLRNLQKITTHPTFMQELSNALDPSQYHALVGWLDGIKDANKSKFQVERGIDNTVEKLVRYTALSELGHSISTLAIQQEIFPRIRNELGRYTKDSKVVATYFSLLGNSAMLFTKGVFDVSKISKEIVDENPAFAEHTSYEFNDRKSIFDEPNVWYRDNAYNLIRWMNTRINITTYLAAKNLAESGQITGVDPKNKKQVIDFANKIIQTVVEANRVIDKSQIQKIEGLGKLLIPFYSAANVQFNQVYSKFMESRYGIIKPVRDGVEAGTIKKTAIRSAVLTKLGLNLLETVVLPAIIMDNLRAFVRNDWDEEKQLNKALRTPITGVTSLVPFLDSATFATEMALDGNPTVKMGVAPAITKSYDIGKLGMELFDVLSGDKDIEDMNGKQAVKIMQGFAPSLPLRLLYDLKQNPLAPAVIPPAPLGLLVAGVYNSIDLSKNPPAKVDVNNATVTMVKEASQDASTEKQKSFINEVLESINEMISPPKPKDLTRVTITNNTGLDLKSELGEDFNNIDVSFENPNGKTIYMGDEKKELKLTDSQYKRIKNIISNVYIPTESNGDFTAVANVKNNIGKNAAFADGAPAGLYQFAMSTIKLYNKRYDVLKQYPTLLQSPYSLVQKGRTDDIREYNEGQRALVWLDTGEHYMYLKKENLEVTGTNLYLHHQLGLNQLVNEVLTSPYTTPSKELLRSILSNAAVWGVKGELDQDVAKMTNGKLYNNLKAGLRANTRKHLLRIGVKEGIENKLNQLLDVDIPTLK